MSWLLFLGMDRLLRLGAGGMPGMGQGATSTDAPTVDTAEQVYISSLALLKVCILIPNLLSAELF